MNKYSILSISLFFTGLLLLGINWVSDGYSEILIFISLLTLLVGLGLNFISLAKGEKGSLKFISLVLYIAVLFGVTWYGPYHILRIITWLKNAAAFIL